MRHIVFAGITGAGLMAGAGAFAQQTQPRPQPEAVAQETVDTLNAETDTDLGRLVDDLLQDTPAPRNTTETDAPVEGAVASDGSTVDELTDEEELDAIEVSYDQYPSATLRALDKITGRSTDIRVQTDTPIVFGSLNIEMKTCYQTPPEVPPESVAFLSIKSTQSVQVETMKDAVDAGEVSTVSEDNPKLFSGWMFASSPGLSALEHPVYDVWVINCNAA